MFVILSLLGCVLGAANFQKVVLTTLNPNAVCNDGSPATYFFRKGTGNGASIWTIYLEGGGYCYDIPSCRERFAETPHFMTSKLLPAELNDETESDDVNHLGINSGDPLPNPHFFNVNQVYLWYCSSDTHSGNQTASSGTGGWYFMGRVIVEALIKHLLQVQSMYTAKYVLLTGFSAGGMGVFHNADFVGSIVKAAIPDVTYKAYVDSGWSLDIVPYYLGVTERDYAKGITTNFNAVYDDECKSVYEASGEQWRCYFGLYSYPFIRTPIFWAQHQYDSAFIDVEPPFNSSTGEYARDVQQTFLLHFSQFENVFQSNCYCHGVEAYDDRWNGIEINEITPSTAVWWFLLGQSSRHVDQCQPMDCNPSCSCIY